MLDDMAYETVDVAEPPVEGVDGTQPEIEADTQADFALETDLQIQDAVDALQQMEGLDLESWQALDAAGRLEMLQGIEDRMATIQERPAVPVGTAELSGNTFGGFDGQAITINAAHLSGDMPFEEFVDTIVHEGRHAYQDYAVRNPGFVSDTARVNAWADNMANYLSAEEYGQELYANQPIEADAWQYADRIRSALFGSARRT